MPPSSKVSFIKDLFMPRYPISNQVFYATHLLNFEIQIPHLKLISPKVQARCQNPDTRRRTASTQTTLQPPSTQTTPITGE